MGEAGRVMEPHSLKLTIKLKREKSVSNSLETTDHSSNAEAEPNASNSSYRPCSLAAITQNQVDFSSEGALEDHSRQDDGKQPLGNSQYEVVPFNPRANGSGEAETPDPISDRPPSAAPRQHSRALPSVGAFTVQCANCFKWRLIPTQEKYEEIREHIIEQPFFCEKGKDWRPDVSCDDPPDLVQDGSRLWAIDKPSIAQPPPGWQRLLKFRGEGSSKFADVYYVAPSGKRLRSMVEVQRYFDEHPEYKDQGLSLSRFSFQIPRPLQENYVRKRPARAAPTSDADDIGTLRMPHPIEVQPISWVSPDDVDTDLQLSRPGHLTDYSEPPDMEHGIHSAKKRKTPPIKIRTNVNSLPNPVNLGEAHQLSFDRSP